MIITIEYVITRIAERVMDEHSKILTLADAQFSEHIVDRIEIPFAISSLSLSTKYHVAGY